MVVISVRPLSLSKPGFKQCGHLQVYEKGSLDLKVAVWLWGDRCRCALCCRMRPEAPFVRVTPYWHDHGRAQGN